MAVRGVCAYDTDQAIKNWLNNYDQEADDQPLGKVSYWHPQYKEELHKPQTRNQWWFDHY